MIHLLGRDFIAALQAFVPIAKPASGGAEVLLRCPFCGDSKNPKHAHFYISVPQTPEDLILYHCKKCPAQGMLTDEVLRKLGCNDPNTLVEIIKHNTEVLKLPKYKTLKNINIYPLRYKYIRNSETNEAKLAYINNRIGSRFTIEDLYKVKIFLNLFDIINQNKLELTRSQNIVRDLDYNFIGFISYDNSYCGLRKVTDAELYPSINKRYINYNLINKTSDSKNFYIIPSQVDITSTRPVRIHIAEGQFDILSIFYNLNMSNTMQNVYMAAGGKSYTQALNFILKELGLINYEIHYYPDKDVDDNEVDRIVTSKINLLPADIYIHRNIYPGEKDYGVPMGRIKDYVRVIKDIYV